MVLDKKRKIVWFEYDIKADEIYTSFLDIGFDWFVAVKLLLVEASFLCRSCHSFRLAFLNIIRECKQRRVNPK